MGLAGRFQKLTVTHLMIAAVLLPVQAMPAGAATVVTSSGQELSVAITSPPNGTRAAQPGPVAITGTAAIQSLADATQPLTVMYIMDLSASTNQNGGSCGSVFQCERIGIEALNDSYIPRPSTRAGLVVFATNAAATDVSPNPGIQNLTTPGMTTFPPRSDIERVLDSLLISPARVQQFSTTHELVGAGDLGTATNYDLALTRALNVFGSQASTDTKLAYLISDGDATTFSTSAGSPVRQMQSLGIRVNTYLIHRTRTSCAGTATQSVATITGGTCTLVSNPALLSAALTQPVALSRVEVRVNGGAPTTISVDPSTGAWSHSAAINTGPNTVQATAFASDGTQVSETITVHGINPPQVDAGGPYTVAEGSAVTLAATVTDPDGHPSTLAWTPTDNLDDPSLEDPTYTGVDDGVATLTLTATDPDGLTGSDTTTVTTMNVAPSVDPIVLPSNVNEGQSFTATSAFSDPGLADTHTVLWDWDDGTTTTQTPGQGPLSADHTYATGGSYTIRLTVTDDDGGSASVTHGPFHVNIAPAAHAGGPYTVPEGSSVTLSGATASDPDGDPLTPSWSPTAGLDDPSLLHPTFAGVDDGTTTLTLTVTDPGGLTASSDTTVTVTNVRPTITDLSLSAHVVQPGEPVTLTIQFDDPGLADTHQVIVVWGDGGPQPPQPVAPNARVTTITHHYAAAGLFIPHVILRDDDGGQDQGFAPPIRVNTPPQVEAGGPYVVDEGSSVQLDATAFDPDGDPLLLQWTGTPVLFPTDEDPWFTGVDDGTVHLTLTATDPYGATAIDVAVVTVLNVAPSLTVNGVPSGPIPVGGMVDLEVTIFDPGVLDTHDVEVDWGDGSPPTTLPAPGGVATPSHTYGTAGVHTLRVTATDDDGGSDTAWFTITVNRPPTADAGGPYAVDEGSSVLLDGTATDPDGDPLTIAWTPDGDLDDGTLEDPTFTGADDGVVTLTMRATDPFGAFDEDTTTVTVHNVAPTITMFAGPLDPVPLGTSLQAFAKFTDPGLLDTHTAVIDWGDGSSSAAAVGYATAGLGTVEGSHTYASAGIHRLRLTVTDDDGGIATELFEFVVVFDPNGGFVTGGGHFWSPAGAHQLVPGAEGRATFGFVAKYKKGATVPEGNTEFQFKAGNLNFKSTAYDWLVISGPQAQYRGQGTINGGGSYDFMLSLVDGDLGGDGIDRIRMRIWDRSGGGLVYDNQLGDASDAPASTALTGGSITIHKEKKR